jgi:glutamate 5-kinase
MSRIVLKVGSNLLVKKSGELDRRYIAELAREIANLKSLENEVVLVSSGAKAAGFGYISGRSAEHDLYLKQALCAAGQVQLMKLYETVFDLYGEKVAQILVNRDDFGHRKRFLNLRNTLIGLLEMGVIPIVNENDTTSTEEIMFGDNDILAAMFAMGWKADYLILMSTVDGIYNEEGKVMRVFDSAIKIKSMSGSSWGTGGIGTKIRAARGASASGIKCCICNGRELSNIGKFIHGIETGTVFEPIDSSPGARKIWIGFLSTPGGSLIINRGAITALKRGKSLLAVGVERVEGEFSQGEVVRILSFEGEEIARGISNFSSFEVDRIKGTRSDKLSSILGHDCAKVVVHIDNIYQN